MPQILTRPSSEPPIPTRPLPEPSLVLGQRALPLHKKIAGSNSKPLTLRFAVVSHTILDEADYARFLDHRWHAQWDEHRRSYVATRKEVSEGKTVTIYLHREILNLPRNPDRDCAEQVDHLDHNPLNNTRSNLRVATRTQNQANQRRQRNATHRFRGVSPHKAGHRARFHHNGSKKYHLPVVPLKSEAAYMFNHAVSLLRDSHAQRNEIPPHERPAPARQLELIALVETKLRLLTLIP